MYLSETLTKTLSQTPAQLDKFSSTNELLIHVQEAAMSCLTLGGLEGTTLQASAKIAFACEGDFWPLIL